MISYIKGHPLLPTIKNKCCSKSQEVPYVYHLVDLVALFVLQLQPDI